MDWDLVTWLGRMPGVRGQNLDILELRMLGVVMGLDLSATYDDPEHEPLSLQDFGDVHSPRLG